MDEDTAEAVVTKYKPGWQGGDGVVFHGTEGWIGNIYDVFQASDRNLWRIELKESDEPLPVSREHNRNFIDCVKSREETMCPVEMAIRCAGICHLTRAAALTGKVVKWDPKMKMVIGNPEAAAMLNPKPFRDMWKVW